MKVYFFAAYIISIGLFSCNRDASPVSKAPLSTYGKPVYFGKHITEDSAIDCNELKDKMGASLEFPAKVKGEVIGICPDNNCILRLDLGDGTSMNVKMNNAQVPVLKDMNGKTAIIEGKAYVDTSAVKIVPGHDADSGRSIAETEVTKNPEVSLAFDATGLIIK
jgi:hypothetical protein